MARKRKTGVVEFVVGAIVLLGVFLAAVPAEAWIAVAVLAAIAAVVYLLVGAKRKAGPVAEDDGRRARSRATRTARESTKGRATRPTQDLPIPLEDDAPVSLAGLRRDEPDGYRLPARPASYGNAKWVGVGQTVEVAGLTLPGGMVYVGTSLGTPYGVNDPCLIDPSRRVASRGDYSVGEMGYWPSYSDINPTQRRAYLEWIVGGRQDPRADIGYVFLYFYGLERRAVLDGAKDPVARGDYPNIAQELRRLLGIYGGASGSFRRYAAELLDWVSLADHTQRLYEQPVPEFPRTYELPLYLRLALGQASVDSVPVPPHLALAWAKLDPSTRLRTPAVRCQGEFERLFVQKYGEVHGEGIVLPRNRTRLKFVYRAASAGFRGYDELRMNFGEIPDVTALTGPQRKIQLIVDAATKELEPYSRVIGRNPEAGAQLEGLLHLPATLWPEEAQAAIAKLKSRMGGGLVVLTFAELLSTFKAQAHATKERARALARALESLNIGIEPDVLGGAKLPKSEEKVVLFSVPAGEPSSRATPSYQAAMLTLQLASAVAAADGEFSVQEMGHLRAQVQSWTHLTPNHVRRLLAHLRLLMVVPASLSALRRKLEPLDAAAKETIGAFMATVAQADGEVAPAEVKMLEKVYKALGIDPKKVYSHVHAVTAEASRRDEKGKPAVGGGLRLDPARIEALQKDTAAVSALLAGIFREEDPAEMEEPSVQDVDEAEQVGEAPASILGLDDAHTALARMMLSRPHWSREELLDVAADLEVMLDGALEHINEAAFDVHEIPFFGKRSANDILAPLMTAC